MPLPISDILDAYRADLANSGKEGFSASDAAWLQFGLLLQRTVGMPDNQRSRHLRNGAAAIANVAPPGPVSMAIASLAHAPNTRESVAEALSFTVLKVANDAEDAGAFAVATAMLDSARFLIGLAEFRLQGRLLAQQARVLRKIGELDVALELYDEVADLAETHADSELRARAHLGRGVIARIHGNYPEARREYLMVLESQGDTDALRDLRTLAYQGLLVTSAVAGDFESALRYGSLALEHPRDEDQRAEMLTNLASVCQDLGLYRAALNGYLRAIAGTTISRVRLSAFGSAATAAARLGERRTMANLVTAGRRLVNAAAPQYELADMLREFAEAHEIVGDTEAAARFRTDALRRAKRGQFFEIVHRLETAPRAPAKTPTLAADALDIANHLASADSDELLAVAVSTDR